MEPFEMPAIIQNVNASNRPQARLIWEALHECMLANNDMRAEMIALADVYGNEIVVSVAKVFKQKLWVR